MNTKHAQQGGSLGFSLKGMRCKLKNTPSEWEAEGHTGVIEDYSSAGSTYRVLLDPADQVSAWVKRDQFDLLPQEPGPLSRAEAENLIDELLQADRGGETAERTRLREEIVNRLTTGSPFWPTPAGLNRS